MGEERGSSLHFADHLRAFREQLDNLKQLFSRLEEEYEVEAAFSAKKIISLGESDIVVEPKRSSRAPVTPSQPELERRSQSSQRSRQSSQVSENPVVSTTGGSQLVRALQSGSFEDVLHLLKSGSSPNEQFNMLEVNGKIFSTGSALTVAVLKGRPRCVRALLTHNAEVDSTYSFSAGAEQKEWSGTNLHATVPRGDLEMMKDLVKFKANLHTPSSTDANLVWQAAYFGQKPIAEYLIEHDVEADKKAHSQDNHNLRYTPLHIASYAGHSGVVEVLLAARADLTVTDGMGHRPLDDAVLMGHASVVQQLVAGSGDIFKVISTEYCLRDDTGLPNMVRAMTRKKSYREFKETSPRENDRRCLDMVLQSGNAVLMSAVAKGLQRAPGCLQSLHKRDFVKFLSSDGDAPLHILAAIFQPVPILFWDLRNGVRMRETRNSAFIDCRDEMNIAEGPHFRIMQGKFNSGQILGDPVRTFVDGLLPPEKPTWGDHMFVPAASFMCHVPRLHNDLRVLLAIADCRNDEIFGNRGCQAIINMKWKGEMWGARSRLLMAFVEVLNLVLVNFILNKELIQGDLEQLDAGLYIALVLAGMVWGITTFCELSQVVGYFASGLRMRYLATARYWYDGIVAIYTGVLILLTGVLGSAKASASPPYNTFLGILVFLKWMRLLWFLRQLRTVGLQILPITSTMFDVGPFLCVLSVYMVGAVNMYYALGLNDFLHSLMLIYRVVVLGDADFYSMENTFDRQMVLMGNVTDKYGNRLIKQQSSEQTDYYWVIQLFVVLVSFVIGLSLINIFVAILCVSYSAAQERAWFSFMRARANIVLDQEAVRVGSSRMCCVFCKRRRNSSSFLAAEQSLAGRSQSQIEQQDFDVAASPAEYIWFACQADSKKSSA